MSAAIVKLTDRFAESEVADEIVIMSLDSGDFFTIAGSAIEIWRLIDGVRDRSGLLAALSREFDGNAETMSAELDEFLAQLRDAGLVG